MTEAQRHEEAKQPERQRLESAHLHRAAHTISHLAHVHPLLFLLNPVLLSFASFVAGTPSVKKGRS